MGDKGFEGSMEVEAGVSLHWQSDTEGNQEASSNRTIPPPSAHLALLHRFNLSCKAKAWLVSFYIVHTCMFISCAPFRLQ